MRILIALFAGALFGAGLAVSDMVDPSRVVGFLQVADGSWDPTLAFVMGGAMIPMFIAWRLTQTLPKPIAGDAFPAEAGTVIDRRLLTGGALFGAGWGIAGYCPGPALSTLLVGGTPVLIFLAAMLVGVLLHDLAIRRWGVFAPA